VWEIPKVINTDKAPTYAKALVSAFFKVVVASTI
jgi:transposase-like protein